MPRQPDHAPGSGVAEPGAPVGNLVVAGLDHVALGLARDALAAGYAVTCLTPGPCWIERLVGELADHDEVAATLLDAVAQGRYRITDDASACAGLDVAVVTELAGCGVEPAGPEPVETAAVAIGPHLRPGALVVLLTTSRVRSAADVFTSTVELLTGLVAGPDYGLGFAIGRRNPGRIDGGGLTVVAGVDNPSVLRTEELYGRFGRETAAVSPVEAAELVAHLLPAVAPDRRDVIGMVHDASHRVGSSDRNGDRDKGTRWS